jgi:glycosyltransferase involved in cell wall biosynthesis
LLRICFCLSHYQPIASGAERQAQRQARELTRLGHHVLVITRELSGYPAQDCIDGVQVHRIIRPRPRGPLFGVSFVATLARALRELRNQFDLIHCHQSLWEAVAAGLVIRNLDKPSVVQPAAGGEYGEIHQLGRTRGRRLLRRLILRNTHFVAISAQIDRELAELGVAPSRRTRLASGVDVESFSPGPSQLDAQLPNRPRVLFLGRLHAQKNLRMLLESWAAARRQIAGSLLLAGDGPERARLQDHAQALGCADSVHFLGPVADPAAHLRAVDVFVLPSSAEGMSNSLLEAMATGLPVITSQVGGNEDLVVQAENGLTVGVSDVPGWAAAMVRLLGDETLRRTLGASARQLIVSRYSIQSIVAEYVKLYERLLG